MIPPPPTLTDMPPEVLTRIMEKLDVRKVFSLRKICKSLRDFIDFQYTRPQLLDLNIYVQSGNIEAWYYTAEGLNVVNYLEIQKLEKSEKSQGNHCKIVHDSREKTLEAVDFLDAFLMDFQFFLRRQNSILRQFRVVHQGNYPSDPNVFQKIFKSIESTLKPRPFPLKTEEFHVAVSRQEEILPVLALMDSDVLKNISIYPVSENGQKLMETGELVKMEQWKRAKELLIEHFVLEISMVDLVHFSFVTVNLRAVEMADLVLLKESFLHTSTPKEFVLTYTHFGDNSDQISQILGDPLISSDIFGRTEKKWTIPVPGQDKELEITHFENLKKFKFTNIKPLGGGVRFF
ncbi:hypothetical protein CAEBREN_28513 [Caenorhabditis brenneri]|uniref:F-box domain-containing protein n=1 Tax=Caenorhabditis brenneri TaxID=135651 RepID=G0NIA9_CAEBE|nr:hypothetical protein CAEBREN_28513 [Caenorhabditis brenneri]